MSDLHDLIPVLNSTGIFIKYIIINRLWRIKMIPFARISTYGNKVHPPVKIFSSGDSIFLLTENGDLWVRGSNYYGKLGIGNTTTSNVLTWTKVHDNVKFVCGSSFVTVIFTKNNRILYCGDKWFETGGVTSSQVSTWTDVTSQFSAVDLSSVLDIKMTYYCIGLVTSKNQLYAKGYDNKLAFGGVKNKATAVLAASDVSSLYTSQTASIYIGTNGFIYRCGVSTNGALGSSTSITSYLSYSPSSTFTIKNVAMMTSNTGLLYTDNSGNTRYFVAGTNTNKQIGNNAASNVITSSYTEIPSENNKFSSLWKNDGVYLSFAVGKNTNNLYYTGTNTYHASGDTANSVGVFTLVPFVFNNISDVICFTTITIVKDSNRWYYCGDGNSGYGLQNVSQFTELPLPV